MPLSPPPSSDWILVSLFALSSLIFFLFCHFLLRIHISPPLTPAIKQGLESVSEMELPSISSPDSKQSQKSRVSNADADGDFSASADFIESDVHSDVTRSCGLILGFVEQEQELLKFSDTDFEPVVSDFKEFGEEVSSSSVDSESKGIKEDFDKVTSVCNEDNGVLQSSGIMEDYFLKTSVCSNSSGVLQPDQPESEGIMEDYDIQTSVFSDSVHQTSKPESSRIMEDCNVDSPFMASDLKNINELLPDSQSIASDLQKITELGLEPTSIVSDLKIFTEFHTYQASGLEDFAELHPHPPSMASDMGNLIEEELKSIKQQQFQSSNGNENSEDGFEHSVAEEIDEHKMVEDGEKNQQGLNYIEIAQVGQEEIVVSREEQSHVSEEGDEDEARTIDDEEIQIPQPTKYKQPILSVPPYSLKRTSWMSCCGLFDVLRSYK